MQEVVARKILKLRAKLGITAEDLLPASIALESEGEASLAPPEEEDGDLRLQSARKKNDGISGDVDPIATLAAGHGRDRHSAEVGAAVPDIGRWKKEVDDMLGLLGTDAEKCAHDYPLAELKRKVLLEM